MADPLTLADVASSTKESFDTWLRRCARKGGPLPSHPPANRAADRFWAAYKGMAPLGTLVGESIAARAGRAGASRRKAEPGIDPTTDPRVNAPPGRVGPQGGAKGSPTDPGEPSFQRRVDAWVRHCFGSEVAEDRVERNHRFLEEALELVQAGGCTPSEAHQLVDYVFGRPVGEVRLEVGGTMNTLAALCTAHGVDLEAAAEAELVRVWGKSDQIRAKWQAKPKHSPLPQ